MCEYNNANDPLCFSQHLRNTYATVAVEMSKAVESC